MLFVNLLTVGCGSLAFAVRLGARDAPAASVLRYLAGAHDALLRALLLPFFPLISR